MWQVTGQRDGASLLVTLESKQAERLDAALQRFQGLVKPGAVLGVQRDVSSLSGLSGKPSNSSIAPSPERPSAAGRRENSNAAAGAAVVADAAHQEEVRRVSGVWQAASAAGLADGVEAAVGSSSQGAAAAAADVPPEQLLSQPLLSD